jgi:hypothetical protein
MSPRSLLVISAAPDSRPSTATLMALVAELRRRPGLSTHLWFLRSDDGDSTAADRVVDDLRRSQPARVIDAVGLSRIAGVLRGRILRRWWKQASPDAVILDDGLGARVIAGRSVVTVVRANDDAPVDAELEGAPLSSADLWMMPAGEDQIGAPVIEAPLGLRDLDRFLEFRTQAARNRVRRSLGVPEDELPLVVGWGSDAWHDGVDVFLRSLWSLERRHGIRARGLWIGLDASDEELDRLGAEAQRCGLDSRVTYVPEGDDDDRFCGDVVLLPCRVVDPTRPHIDEVLVTGTQIVASNASQLVGPGVTQVVDLDAEAAGDALARCLAAERAVVAAELGRAYHVGPLVDDLLASLDGILSHA